MPGPSKTGSAATLDRAIGAHRAGRLTEAESAYLRILRSQPGNPDALHFLGLLRFQQKQPAVAVELVRRSLGIAPGNPHAWNNLGNMLVAEDEPQQALDAYRKATSLLPTLAEAWHNLGICLRRNRCYEDAISSFGKAIDSNPDFALAYESLGMLYYRLARIDEAARLYRRWLQVDPSSPIARHMAAATTGEHVPERADDQYVAKLFDGFANSFDSSLEALSYRAPQLLCAALGDHLHVQSGLLDVLDAGCGTGLCGPLLRSSARTLAGIDLSEGMIGKARERNVYDELAVGELCAFMSARPKRFDVVVAADTLCYFGDLEKPVAAARECLRGRGILAFTVESLRGPGPAPEFRIEPHGRYSHSARYVSGTLDAAGFTVLALEEATLRRERGADVAGLLLVARVA